MATIPLNPSTTANTASAASNSGVWKNVADRTRTATEHVHGKVRGFAGRVHSDGLGKAISGMSTSNKWLAGTALIGSTVAAIAISRNHHRERMALRDQVRQQGFGPETSR